MSNKAPPEVLLPEVLLNEKTDGEKTSRFLKALASFLKHPLGGTGAVIVSLMIVIAFLAPLLTGFSPVSQVLTDRLLPPSAAHWFGTDILGRDVFTRVVYGARPSVLIVLSTLALTAPTGLIIGAISGYAGGWVDAFLMRISDIFMAFPRLVLALAMAATLGGGFLTLIFAISATGWPSFARIARSQALVLARAEFVQAAEVLGASQLRILFVHVIPHCLPAIIVRTALDAPAVLLVAAGLGFLGAGLPPPQPEWGAMVSEGRVVIFENWWISTFPGVFILALSIGFTLIADALRDLFDPRFH